MSFVKVFILVVLLGCQGHGDVRVIDGDTFWCPRYGYVRIEGMDCPERGESGYEEAKEVLEGLLASKDVVVKVVARDRYGRAVGRVFVDGQNVVKVFKARGLSYQHLHPPPRVKLPSGSSP